MKKGIRFKNLQFHEKLGSGGGGSVRRVTFKTPYKGYTEAAAKTIVDLNENEVKIMSRLHHPNIVEWIDFYHRIPVNIILMEYAPNGSLHDYLQDPSKPLSKELTYKWLKEVAFAIEYLHEQHVLHRDIKAKNCILFQTDVLKLCDFGLAREIEHSQTISKQKGTLSYMAPELHRGHPSGGALYSKPSDIYSYGMLILEICARKPPYEDWEWVTIIYKVGSGLRPTIPDGCPRQLAKLMQWCWDAEPEKRPTINNIKEGKYKHFITLIP